MWVPANCYKGSKKISHCATFIMKAEQIKSVLLSQMFLIDFYLGRSIGLKNTNLTMCSNISKEVYSKVSTIRTGRSRLLVFEKKIVLVA